MEFLTLAPGSDRIPVELFQILKDDAVESAALNMQYAICTQYAICRLPAPNDETKKSGKGSFIPESQIVLLLVSVPFPKASSPGFPSISLKFKFLLCLN